MTLDYESRKLLADIYCVNPKKTVAITKRILTNNFIEMLEELQNKKAIKSLSVLENSLQNPLLLGYRTNEGIFYDIIFNVMDWQKIDDYGEGEFNKLVIEPYGKNKQLQTVKETITEKAMELDNNQFRVSDDDFSYSDREHIAFFEVIGILEKEGFLESSNGNFYIDSGEFECDIKLLKDLGELKINDILQFLTVVKL